MAKAKPLFKGHYQPRIPADLGFYDLRLPEVREQQAQMAREAGIEGFCYWHYWFGNGKRLLQRPFNEVVQSGKPNFPFCLAWANHSWKTSTWENGGKDRMIVEQRYLGEEDYTMHFQEVLPSFRDKRYITIEDKPLFAIFDPYNFRDVSNFIKTWQRLAKENGLKGIYFIAICNSTSTLQRNADGTLKRVTPNLQSSERVYNDLLNLGFDGINSFGKSRAEMLCMGKYARIAKKLLHQYLPFLPTHCIDYEKITQHFFAPEDSWQNVYPSIFPQWDRTPRAGSSEGVYIKATPTSFKKHIQDALNVIKNKDVQHQILFLRSWNEWGEGNYVEPDLKYGHGFLDAIQETIV